jgi:hypothetical protein
MPERHIRVENLEEALIVEQALAMYRELRKAAADAPDGQVIDIAEKLAVARGRELTRQTLETVLQTEALASEKKAGRPAAVPAVGPKNIVADNADRSSPRPAC